MFVQVIHCKENKQELRSSAGHTMFLPRAELYLLERVHFSNSHCDTTVVLVKCSPWSKGGIGLSPHKPNGLRVGKGQWGAFGKRQ